MYIKDILIAQSKENASKAKFYRTNRDIFLRYFDSIQQYEAMISAGSFGEMDRVVRCNTEFSVEEFTNK
jgi:hypothetical protein